MSRYLLDTNILIFAISEQYDYISGDVAAILDDHGNQLHASSVSAMELVLLHRAGRISPKRYRTARVRFNIPMPLG